MEGHDGAAQRIRSRAKSLARRLTDRAVRPYFDQVREALPPAPAPGQVADGGGDDHRVQEPVVAPSAPTFSISEFRQRLQSDDPVVADPGAFFLDSAEVTPATTDPLSEDYASEVMATWRALSGRGSYVPEDSESFELDPAIGLPATWPYVSGNPVEVSHYLGAIARTLKLIDRPPPARLLEYGTGWGHMAVTLAATGYEVSAVDLNGNSVELLRRRAELLGIPLEVVRSGFLEYRPPEPVDVVLFYESFHHCDRPFALLDLCVGALAPGGQLIFVAEAVYPDYHVPWGVRPDGGAARMTASEGWLELGFDLEFFRGQLEARGLSVTYEVDPLLGAHGTFLVARAQP